MASIRPPARPKMTRAALTALVRETHPNAKLPAVWVAGVRGYYPDTLGVKGRNDRGVYDDAIFVVTPKDFLAFNGNTDPGAFRKGRGTGAGKGMARLKPGLYRSHALGVHKAGKPGGHPALIQTVAPVTVVRDGIDGDYEDTGFFGINIHRGGITRTNSEGCQTVPPDQWAEFYGAVRGAMLAAQEAVLPYVLLEQSK